MRTFWLFYVVYVLLFICGFLITGILINDIRMLAKVFTIPTVALVGGLGIGGSIELIKANTSWMNK